HARRGLRVGHRFLHQSDVAGGSRARAARRPVGLKANPTVWYVGCSGGNNSVVECDLAKVEVAGSNPVSRSNLRSRSHAKVARRSLGEGGPPLNRELRLASQVADPRMRFIPRPLEGRVLFSGAVAKR